MRWVCCVRRIVIVSGGEVGVGVQGEKKPEIMITLCLKLSCCVFPRW